MEILNLKITFEKTYCQKKFSVAFRYIGQMTHVNIWSYVMNQTEIESVYRDCLFIQCGDVVQWIQFREGTRGQMKMRWPSGVLTESETINSS